MVGLVSGLHILVSDERARALAAECPLTYGQVQALIAAHGLPMGRSSASWADWVESGPAADVARWVFELWADRYCDRLHSERAVAM